MGACATGTVVTGAWNTTRYTDGSYDVCNTVTDRAGYSTTAVLKVTVTNAVPAPAPGPAGRRRTPAADIPASPAPISATPGAPAQDKDAPKAPSKLAVVQPRSKKGPNALIPLTLRWVNPTAADLARVVVILNLKHAPRGIKDGSVVYDGLRTSTAFKLRAGKSGYVALYAYDRTGNVSAPARRTVSLASLIPLRPLTGSSVTTAPRMTWKAQEGIAYYNVQVYRNGRRILVGWPSKASFQLPDLPAHSGHLHLVRVAGVQACERRHDVRRPDRPRDVRVREVDPPRGFTDAACLEQHRLRLRLTTTATRLVASKPIADVAQLVEHQLPKLRVASSSLVVRF